MNLAEKIARVLLGGILLVFGAEYVFHFMPELPFTEAGGRYLEALFATGYMFPLIKTVEVVGALLVLSGRFVPLGVLLLAPVIVNIALYHLVLDPNGAFIAAILVACEAVLAVAHRRTFRPLFVPQSRAAAPVGSSDDLVPAVAARP